MKAGNIKKGQYIKHKNKPFLVTGTEFSFYGRGAAHMKLKLKSLDGTSSESVTYKSNDNLEELEVSSQELQFLYLDKDNVVLMHPRSYEQTQVPLSLLEGKEKMLVAETKVYVLTFEDQPVGVSLPVKVKLKVLKAPDATAGNRAKAAKKDVTLETGLVVQAPLFVKEGDEIIIDTATGHYASKG